MKIGIVSTAVPLINGGGRFIVDWLDIKLREYGHQVETVYLPFVADDAEIMPQMAAFRMMELESHFDRVIALRPPAHVIRHPRKIVWFIHHLRFFYDLWGTAYSAHLDTAANRALRAAIIAADNVALGEAYRVFTNSQVVGDRLRKFNQIESEPLFPPILSPEMFYAADYGEEVVSVCRVEHHKRQHLLIDAMAHTRTPVRLRLCGSSASPDYLNDLRESVARLGVADKVVLDFRWISEEEKARLLSTALASAYLPFDEDSYGYPTIEAAHAARCTITVSDSGGVPEFVTNDYNGYVTAPEPAAVAEAFDRLYMDRALARSMGAAARARIDELGINWEKVIGRLLA